MKLRPALLPALAAALVAVSLAALSGDAGAQSTSPIQLIAIDADPAGNTATSFGTLEPCVRVEPGASVSVDVVVDAVPADRPFIGFGVNIEYDPAVLQATAVDNEFLLGSTGSYEPVEGLSDILPDSDGDLVIAVADLASNTSPGANMESGKGVLSRVTFKALAAGTSDVAPGFAPPDVYPALYDDQNTTIEVRTIAGIKIAVGQDCPAGETQIQPTTLPSLASIDPSSAPSPEPTAADGSPATPGPSGSPAGSATARATGTPRASVTPAVDGATGEGDGGTSTGTVILVVALAMAGVALAAGGGFMLYRRRAGGA